jgi:hypothetical protein
MLVGWEWMGMLIRKETGTILWNGEDVAMERGFVLGSGGNRIQETAESKGTIVHWHYRMHRNECTEAQVEPTRFDRRFDSVLHRIH